MSETNKKHIAFLFLLCIAVTFVPFNPFHDHQEDVQICADHVGGEVTPCHETLFHKDSTKHNCIHEWHVSKKIEECEICKFTSTRRFQFIPIDSSTPSIIENYENLINLEASITFIQLNRCIQDRAPPIS